MSKGKFKPTRSSEEDLAAESFDTDAAIATHGEDTAAVAGYLDAEVDLDEMGDE